VAFSASFTIKAVDQFSAVAKAVAKNARLMKKAINELGVASEKTAGLQKQMAYSLRQNAQDFEKARKAASNYRQELNKIKPARGGGPGGGGGRSGGGSHMGGALGGLAGGIAGAAGAYLGASGVSASITNFMAIEDALADVAAITGQTGAQLKLVEQYAFDLGKTFGKSGADMLEVFKIVGSKRSELLTNPAALKEFSNIALKLSAAGGVDAATAAETLSKSIDAMGKGAGDAKRFADIIASGTRVGSVEVNEMSDALRNIGGVAAEAGIDFEQVNAGLQALGKIRTGAMAGTSFAGILQKMSIAGVDFRKSGLAGGLEQVAATMDKMKTDAQKLEFMKQLVGADFAGEALFLVRNTQLMRDYEKQIRASNGALDEMANIRLKTMSTRLGSVKSVIGASFFKGMADAAPAINQLMNSIDSILGKDASGVSSVIAGLTKLASLSLSSLINTFDLLGKFMGIAAGRAGADISALTGFASGDATWEQTKAALSENRMNANQMGRETLDGILTIKVDQDGKVQGSSLTGAPFKLGNSTAGG